MRGTTAKMLRRLAAQPGFPSAIQAQLYRKLKAAWNQIPRDKRGGRRRQNGYGGSRRQGFDAFELLSLATGLEWKAPNGKKEKATEAEALPAAEG